MESSLFDEDFPFVSSLEPQAYFSEPLDSSETVKIDLPVVHYHEIGHKLIGLYLTTGFHQYLMPVPTLDSP